MLSLMKFPFSLNMRNIFVLLLILFSNSDFVFAQRNRKASKASVTNPIENARKEILKKNYPNAIDILRKSIEEQEKLRKPKYDVDLMQSLIDSVEVEMMRIRNTQKVVFVDSMVIAKTKFLSAYNVNREVGRIVYSNQLSTLIKKNFDQTGQVAFLNELCDHVYFSQRTNGASLLHSSVRFGNSWDKPKMLQMIGNHDTEQGYPFIMTDGITLYYAAKGPESYGGWDIFVTRYDHDSGKYLKAQNLGMPFNTEANDYLYVIDETTNTGYFATDRHHGPDSVCVYAFIPSDVHSSFSSETPFETVRNAAYIHSIRESQVGMHEQIKAWKQRKENAATIIEKDVKSRFVINDHVVYSDLSQFKSAEARAMAEKLLRLYDAKTTVVELLTILRSQYAEQRTTVLFDNILQSETELNRLLKEIRATEKTMRNLEIKELKNN